MISVSALMVVTATICVSSMEMDIPGSPASGMGESKTNQVFEGQRQWLMSFDDAKRIAREKRLPLLLHFEAEWCGACRTMETSVMNQESVLNHLGSSVIAVKVNADRDPGLISQYGIVSLPTEIFIDADGKETGRYVGGTTLNDYIARLGNTRTPVTGTTTDSATTAEPDDENLRPCLLVKREGNVVGLGGYSPIAMTVEKKWLKGKEEFLGTYLGVDYFFQSGEERELFFASPEQYIPRLHGCDPVELQLANRAEAGAIELGAFYKGRLFFFLNEKNRRRFQNNPAWYMEGLSTGDIENADEYPFLKTMTLN